MTLRVGDEAAIRVTVATLWSTPDAVRPVHATAVLAPCNVRGWIAEMTTDEQDYGGVVSQVLLGDRVIVEEIRRDDWVRVVAVTQPAAGIDPRGYPGWLPADQLCPVAPTDPADSTQPFIVDATATDLRSAPHGEVVLPGVLLGTLLTPTGGQHAGWQPVQVAGHAEPLWSRVKDLRPLPTRPPTGDEVLAEARRLLGTTYLWGGLSPYGIDCSGLVHLVWRRLGVRLPRDAHEQAAATTAVPLADEKPGDLYFFARPGRPVHHVGIVAAAPGDDGAGWRWMLHASSTEHRVVENAMPPDHAATLVGARRVRFVVRLPGADLHGPLA
jgi:cell wall-associated NlpC family hydrolase